jgi:hypothetical protein
MGAFGIAGSGIAELGGVSEFPVGAGVVGDNEPVGITGSGVAELGGVSDPDGDDDALPSMDVSDDSDGGEFGAPIVEGGVVGAPVGEPGPFAAPGTVRPASASGSAGCFLLTVVLPSVGAIELSEAIMRHRPRKVEFQLCQ